MTPTEPLWLAIARYAIQMFEVHQFDWRDRAHDALGLPVELIGAALTASPVIHLRTRDEPYFRQVKVGAT